MRCMIIICACMLSVSGAGAQTADFSSFPLDLPVIYVLDDTGHEVSGRLVSFDRDSLTLRTSDRDVSFELDQVRAVYKRGDSLKNGALIGAVVGLAAGAIVARMADCADRDGHVRSCSAGESAGMMALSAGLYAAIGVGIDSVIPGRTRIFRSGRAAPVALRLIGLPWQKGLAVRLTGAW